MMMMMMMSVHFTVSFLLSIKYSNEKTIMKARHGSPQYLYDHRASSIISNISH